MKIFKKILAFTCMLSLLTAIALFSASAVPAPLPIGNVDFSYDYFSGNDISIKDATLIQKYIAGLEELSKAQQYCADTDFDCKITIKDATMIQRVVAGIIKKFPYPEDFRYSWDYIRSDCFYANYDSGKAMVGVPVTFTADAYGGEKPFSYEYKIDGEVVRERSEEPSFTCTFDEAGTYNIEVIMYNCFDTTCKEEMKYEVVEPYTSDTVMLKALYYNKNTRHESEYGTLVTAEAFMGSGEYEYCFYYDGEFVQDYSESNQIYIEYGDPYYEAGIHDLTVYVRDKTAPNIVCEGNLDIYVSAAIG